MSPTGESQPNVLLIVLDSVRAANTSIHSHCNGTTPFLDAFADSATTYQEARAPGTESISSHTSIFTGLSVREHGITNRHHRLSSGNTIWEELSKNGYDTAVFSNNPFLTELPVGLSDAFDHVVGRREEQPFPEAVNPKNFVIDAADRGPKKYFDFIKAAIENGRILGSLLNGLSFKFSGSLDRYLPSQLGPDSSADLYANRFLEWHDERDGPWAACINFMDAHYPYEPGPDYDRWGGERIRNIQRDIEDQAWEFVGGNRPWGERRAIEALYDGAIRRMDAAVEQIVKSLQEADDLDNTMVVVTADHGEGFGERSRVQENARIVGHGNGGLPECVLHVPLVVKYPGQTTGRTSDSVTSLAEFAAAVEDTLTNGGEEGSFLPADGTIVCSTDGVDPDTARRAREYCESITPYDLDADAVFVDEGHDVRKHVRWGEESCVIHIRDAKTSWLVPDEIPDIGSAIENLTDAGVRVQTDEDIAEDVVERLESLGYA